MKLWAFAGLLAGLFLLTSRKSKASTAAVRIQQRDDSDRRYDVDDFITDQAL